MEEPQRPRVWGLPTAKPAPAPETIPVAEAARRLGISADTCRKWMRADMADGAGRVPGGRCLGSAYVIVRATFDRALRDGLEPERTKPAPGPAVDLAAIRRHLAELDRLVADAS